jgi:precorrin-2 dehydrogenase
VTDFRYPAVLSLCGRACLLVGGGAVAERKAEGLLDAGARLTVVSPHLTARLLALAEDARLRWIPREYARGDVAGFALVVGATDDAAVNAGLAAEAREHGAWVNCADDPAHCDFILPAVVRRGAVTVAVSTGGTSPAMARLLREELEEIITAEHGALADVVADVRRCLRERGVAPGIDEWRRALDAEVRRLVAAGRIDLARERLRERLGA